MEQNGNIRYDSSTTKYMGWAAVAFYSKPFAFGNVESDRDRCTNLGNAGIFWIVLSVILLFPKKTRRAGILSVGALGSLCVTNFLLKNYVARVRPYEVVQGLQCLIPAQKDWSFPSGHASASFASAVVIYKSCHRGIGVPALILAFAISLSRLYVGVHYPSDVIVGMIIGTLIALILFWIFGEKKYKARARRHR